MEHWVNRKVNKKLQWVSFKKQEKKKVKKNKKNIDNMKILKCCFIVTVYKASIYFALHYELFIHKLRIISANECYI